MEVKTIVNINCAVIQFIVVSHVTGVVGKKRLEHSKPLNTKSTQHGLMFNLKQQPVRLYFKASLLQCHYTKKVPSNINWLHFMVTL